jgi:hypothetical protein
LPVHRTALAVSRQVRCRGGGRSGIENAYLSYSGFKPFVIEGGYMDLPYTLDGRR